MTKRLVDIDDSLLDEAKARLGAETIKETVNAALARVANEPSRSEADVREALRAFAAATQDLRDPEVMDGAWR